MSQFYIETIDDLNNTVAVVFTSGVFTALPLFVPWIGPRPIRRVRVSVSGDSTTGLSETILYWRLEASKLKISTYSDPSSRFNLNATYNANALGDAFSFIGAPVSTTGFRITRNLQLSVGFFHQTLHFGDVPELNPTPWHTTMLLMDDAQQSAAF